MINKEIENLMKEATIIHKPIDFKVDMLKPCSIPISYIGIESSKEDRGVLDKIDRYIINENATIIFWKDGTKTISRVDAEDTFDKEIGFMIAVYKYLGTNYTKPRWSKTEMKKQLNCVKGSKLYEFLFINFNKYTFNDTNKSRRYLSELKVEKSKKKDKPLPKTNQRVIITNTGCYYSAYEEFIKKYFPDYLKYWKRESYGYSINKIYNLIGTEKQIRGYFDKVSLIQDPDTKEVFLFSDDGLKILEDEIEVL